MPDTEERLRASEERFRTLFEAAGDAIFLMDGDTFVACNQKTLEMFGCPRERIVGQHPYTLSPPTQPDGQDSKEAAAARIAAALGGELQRFPWRHIRCDGSPFDAEVTLARVQLEGRFFLQAIVRDVTDEFSLRRLQERLVSIIENTPEYIGISTTDGETVYLNDSFRRIVPTRFRDAFEAGKPIPTSVFYPPDTYAMLRDTAVPYAIRHGVWQGEAALVDSQGKPFSTLQTIIAHPDATGKAEYLSTICRDIEAYKRAQAELASSERRFRRLVENARDVLLILDDAGRTVYATHNIRFVLGYTPEEFIEHDQSLEDPWTDFHPDDRASVAAKFADVSATPGAVASGTARYTRRDGTRFWMEYTFANRHDDPALNAITVAFRDVTAAHELAEASAQERNLLELAQNALHIGFWYSDPDYGGLLHWTPETYRIFGFSADSFDGKVETFFRAIHPDDSSRVRAASMASLDPNVRAPYAVEHRIIRADTKAVRWVRQEGVVLWQDNRAVRFVGIVRDITDQRAAEQRFRALVEHSGDVIMIFSPEGKRTYVSPNVEGFTGRTVEEALAIVDPAANVHPDDQARVRDMLHRVVTTPNAIEHAMFRLQHKDGHYFWAEGVAANRTDTPGINGTVVNVRDVTPIQQAAENYRVLADASADIIVRLTLDGTVLFINAYGARSYGKTPEDIVGKKIGELFPKEFSDRMQENIGRVLVGGESLLLEAALPLAMGTRILNTRISAVRGPTGKPEGILIISRDVSEEHRVEKRFHALFDNALEGIAYCQMLFQDGVANDFRYVDVNPAFAKLTGLRDVTGKTFTEVLPGIRESNPEILAAYARVVATGTPERFETFSPAFNGWLAVTAFRPEEGHFAVVFENVTEQKEARDRLDAVINAIGDPLVVKDDQHRWVLVNDAFCRLLARTREELVGKSDYDFFPAALADISWAKDDEAMRTGAEVTVEEEIAVPRGGPVTFLTKKTVYAGPVGQRFVVAVMRDVSAMKRAQKSEARADELERLNKVMVGRELQMIALKQENEQLRAQLRKPSEGGPGQAA